MTEPFRCGFIALVGRPNVGKSTLLNRLVGQKISITSNKPQTTRHRILGIHTTHIAQFIYVDTPGLHDIKSNAMNRIMNREARNAIADVDVVVFLSEAGKWTKQDEEVLAILRESGKPVVAVINKVDLIANKEELLPAISQLSSKMEFLDIVPVSARKGTNLDELQSLLEKKLPESIAFFPEEQVTDRSLRFQSAEIIREKLMRVLGREIPYQLTVGIEQFEEDQRMIRISAIIWISRENQKPIIIGKKGEVLKKVGTEARKDLEMFTDKKVYLNLWVKVKEGWADDERTLKSLGYGDEL